MSTTKLFSRRQKMLLKMKVLYCPKLPQRPKFPHLTVLLYWHPIFLFIYCQTFEDRVPVEEWWNCMALFNSLAPGRSGCDSKNGIFNLVLLIGIFRSFHDNALQWMPQGLTDDKSALVQVMAWCRQATSHYLSQCWLSSLSPYGVARPQWVDNHF